MEANKCVLVIEDDPDISNAYQMILEDEGYTAVVAGTHSEARQILAGDKGFMAILSDGCTDHPHGFGRDSDVVCFLKEKTHGTIPVIVVTADEATGIAARQAGASEALAKPIKMDRLLNALHAIENPNVQLAVGRAR